MEAEAMSAQGWSSLPADLVNRVADSLLATDDLDYYMDLRAVCQHWRSSTADPRSNDPRFRPTQWIMLDEVKHYADDDSRLFVNVATGRFFRRSFPVLRDYDLVTSTTGGLLVLATDRDSAASSTHASVRVLNPFTGSSIDFASWRRTSSLPLIAAAKCAAMKRCSGSNKASKIFNCLVADVGRRSYAVRVPGGDMLAVLKRRRGVDVFKVDSDGNVMRRVRSIGNLALFLGVRCVAVDVGMFKGIQANCAYFPMADRFMEFAIYKVGIEAGAEEQEPEFVDIAVTYSRPYCYWYFHLTPFTLTQVLCNYTMDIARHPPSWELNSHEHSFSETAPYMHRLREEEDDDEEEEEEE